MSHVTGVIGISSSELSRFAVFYHSLANVQKPPHTALAHSTGASIATNRNEVTEKALQSGAEWIWYVDDDQMFAPDALTRLLSRRLDIVSGIYLQRSAPFYPHMYHRGDKQGVYPRMLESGDSGLVELEAVGAGCLLVKTKVLRALDRPFWRLGQIRSDVWGDDLDFCNRVRAAGFKVWCDLDVRVGHIFSGIVTPTLNQDQTWSTTLSQLDNTPFVSWPAATEMQ